MKDTRMSMIVPTVHCGRMKATGPGRQPRTGLTLYSKPSIRAITACRGGA